MKHKYITLLLLVLSMYATSVNAFYFWVDGFKYRTVDKNEPIVELVSVPLRYEGSCAVPSSVKYQGKSYRVVSVAPSAFCGCVKLEKVVIPAGITNIGEWAFSGCSRLSKVLLSEDVRVIGHSAFRGCRSLSSIVIPSLVTEIEELLFGDCVMLSEVRIASGVHTVDFSAFNGCGSLKRVVCASECPPAAASKVFEDGVFADVTLAVPRGCKAVYEQAPVWCGFATIVEE